MTADQIRHLQEEYYSKYMPSPKWDSMWQDQAAVLSIIDKNKCSSYFEIGVWEGFTSRLVWEYGIKRVGGVDIYDKMNIPHDMPEHPQSPKEYIGKYLREVGVEIDFCDSRRYRPIGQYDAVLIDANHTYLHVKADTLLALCMRPKVIMWHDYLNCHAGVDQWITEMINTNPVLFDIKLYPGSIVAYLELP